MALAVLPHTNARVADPTKALKDALESFERSLTDEQRQQYQAISAKPDASSVIAFVAKVDADTSNFTKRCVAPRLCTFLEAIQQFAGVVDTFANSNPQICALVWGGVKTALLAASNVASYFEKVTSMIMTIGKSCPTYQQFGQLYPGCTELQHALCDYYAAVVQLCIKIVQVSRRLPIAQTLSSIFISFETEFRPLLDQLDRTLNIVRLQISLASKQDQQQTKKLFEYERQDNTKFRQLSLKFHEQSKSEYSEARQWRINKMKRDIAKLKCQIKDDLSTVNYIKPWKQAMQQCIPTTAKWLQQEFIFRQWKDDPDTAILWCPGTMGVGKTVIMANVVTYLHSSRTNEDTISYYFCQTENAASLSARNILGSFARQMLENYITHAKYNDLIRIRKELDQCENSEIQKVAQAINELCEKHTKSFKIICGGRPELEQQFFKAVRPDYKISVTEAKVKPDMDTYITTTLTRRLEEGQLRLGDPKLILKISEALQKGSNGMFLWAHFSIEELCAQCSDDEILKALEHLPGGLSELFNRYLHRVRERTAAAKAIKLLQLCGVVKRPLTILEYQEALSLSPEQQSFERKKVPNDMNKVIGDCCGFVFIDEEEDTVHYIHHSVKQHLFITNGFKTAEFDIDKIDLHLGILCLSYLDFSYFKHQLMKVKVGLTTPVKPIELGTIPIQQSNNVINRVALTLLSHRSHFKHLTYQELEQKYKEVLGDMASAHPESSVKEREYQFFDYASNYWYCHTTKIDPETQNNLWRLFHRCVEGDDVLIHRPWEPAESTREEKNNLARMVLWAFAYGHKALVLHLERRRAYTFADELKYKILFKAAVHNASLADYIIISCSLSCSTLTQELRHFVRQQNNNILASILQFGINVDTQIYGETALLAATRGGHADTVRILLDAGADVNIHSGRYGRTALHEAVWKGHMEVIRLLLSAGADVNAYTYETRETVLQEAVNIGRPEVVWLLLTAGTDPNASPSNGRPPPLQIAAQRGNSDIVQLLLAAGADVSTSAGYRGQTALEAAVLEGQAEVVLLLLTSGADVNGSTNSCGFRRELLKRSEPYQKNTRVVQLLLAAGAGVNDCADPDRTMLLQAATLGFGDDMLQMG